MGGVNNGPSEADLANLRTDSGWAAEQQRRDAQLADMAAGNLHGWESIQSYQTWLDQQDSLHGVGAYSPSGIAARLRAPNAADANVGAAARAAAIRAATGRGQAWALAQGDGTQLQQGFLGDVTTAPTGSVTDGGLPQPGADVPAQAPKTLQENRQSGATPIAVTPARMGTIWGTPKRYP